MHVLVTGHSRGLGAALAEVYLDRGATVYGVARGTLAHASDRLVQVRADFSDPDGVGAALDRLVPAATALDVVFLNAGVLGPIAALTRTPLSELRAVMDVNVWANKAALDWLAGRSSAARQVVLMSSGAAVSGQYGWGPYALSKAALNMLAALYAQELPASHLTALAPGLVDTAMQETLRGESAREFPSLERLHGARGTPAMPPPRAAAERLAGIVPRLVDYPSGAFVDVRKAFAD